MLIIIYFQQTKICLNKNATNRNLFDICLNKKYYFQEKHNTSSGSRFLSMPTGTNDAFYDYFFISNLFKSSSSRN